MAQLNSIIERLDRGKQTVVSDRLTKTLQVLTPTGQLEETTSIQVVQKTPGLALVTATFWASIGEGDE